MFVVTDVLHIPRPIVNQILRQAEHAAEEEVCGLIAGRAERMQRCLPVRNIAADRRRLFEMEPQGLVRAMREIRESGEALMAIYHSHPAAPAQPSATDIAQSEYPNVLYLVVSLQIKGVLEMRGFRLHGERVEEVPIAL